MLSDAELAREVIQMTDSWTSELFAAPDATRVVFPMSRLVVDVERFSEDADEPMSKVGMGMLYSHTSAGVPLRRPLAQIERLALKSHYDAHHAALEAATHRELAMGSALIVDCHSFPSTPLPCDMDQSLTRPQFCLGTDAFHTPPALLNRAEEALTKMGFTVAVNRPYTGTLVPFAFYGKDPRVASLMVEVNRSLYMDEATGERSGGFLATQRAIVTVLEDLRVS